MSRAVAWLLALAALLASAAPARADERILSYDSELRLQADGSLDVIETLQIRAEGVNIHRGIYRTFPVRYRDRLDNAVVVDFQLISVERDGRPEAHFVENAGNDIRINTGNDDLLPVPATYTWRLRYRTNRQVGFFDVHDELYFNAIGTDWEFPIDAATVTVKLPQAVPEEQLRLRAYTGPFGIAASDYGVQVVADDTVRFNLTRPLRPREGMTIAVGFPKGLIAVPDEAQKMRWFLRDNGGVLVALIGLGLLLAFYLWRWQQVGRDPPAGPLFPHYDPPEGWGPGEVRQLLRSAHDSRTFAADLVDMAVRGFLTIHNNGSDWTLERVAGSPTTGLASSQRAIAAALFAHGETTLELQEEEAARIGGARSAQAKALTARLVPRYVVNNGASLLGGIGLSVAVMVLGFAVAGGSGGAGVPVLVLVGGVMVVAHVLFGFLLRAPTIAGRKVLDQVEGLRLYLTVAESEAIAATPLPGDTGTVPALDAARYERLLPYAMALDVEADWTRRFTEAVGVQEASRCQPDWYRGDGTPLGLAGLGSSLGDSLSSQVSTASSPPGSSSGSDGGGFSGGGGGGGGGGGR